MDFSSIPNDLDDDEDNSDDATDTKESETVPDNKWPWESVRDHLRDALAEVSVLSDVLTIATRECGRDHNGQPKRYMILDGKYLHSLTQYGFIRNSGIFSIHFTEALCTRFPKNIPTSFMDAPNTKIALQ